jgi:hypothetical protein
LTDEEIQRAIEFLIQQQAQYVARLERDESRIARLAEFFSMLVELARGTDERLDTISQTMATLSNTMNELVQRMIMLSDVQRQAEARVIEMRRIADERLAQNEVRFERDESRLAKLEDSYALLVELAHKHQ